MSVLRMVVSLLAILATQITVAEENKAPTLTTSEVRDGLYLSLIHI